MIDENKAFFAVLNTASTILDPVAIGSMARLPEATSLGDPLILRETGETLREL